MSAISYGVASERVETGDMGEGWVAILGRDETAGLTEFISIDGKHNGINQSGGLV